MDEVTIEATGYPDMPTGTDQMMQYNTSETPVDPSTNTMYTDPSTYGTDPSMALPSTYPTLSPEQTEMMKQVGAGMAVFGGFMMVVGLILLTIFLIAGWKIFKKAGQPGWAALVPFYNFYIFLKIVGRPTWWMLSLLAGFIPFVGPIVGLVVGIILALDLAKSFGKSQTFGIIGLWLFSFIGALILAFGSAKYVGPAHTPTTPTPTTPATPPTK